MLHLKFVEENMEKKLDNFKKSILTAIKRSADNTETTISKSVTSYSSTAKVNSNILPTGDIKQAVKVKRRAEKRWRTIKMKEIRSNNLIIHGVPEIHNGEKFANIKKDIQNLVKDRHLLENDDIQTVFGWSTKNGYSLVQKNNQK